MANAIKIVVADDDALSRRLTRRVLENAGYDVVSLENGRQAEELLSQAGGPRLALLDWEMPGLDGPGVCRSIRRRTDQPYTYIVLLTSKESKGDLVAGLEAGADDYLTKPCNAEELTARLRTGQRILQLQDRLFHDARHDFLTQLPNRAYFLDRLNHCLQRSARDSKYRFAILFLDLDRFKIVNDKLGHAAGDELIRQVAERLRQSTGRKGPRATDDLVARLGGDEFTILLGDIRSAADAARVASRVHKKLAPPFDIAGHAVRVDASIGVSVTSGGRDSADDILRRADDAMYRSKTSRAKTNSAKTNKRELSGSIKP